MARHATPPTPGGTRVDGAPPPADAPAMKALVTGAGGFLGTALVRALRREGHEVRALLRPGAVAESLAGPGVEIARGDVTDPSSLPGSVAGCDVVFHLAGVRRGTRREDF